MEKQTGRRTAICISPFNELAMGSTASSSEDSGLILCDVTLREGETAPGASFTQKEKVELAKRLDQSGVGQIQICLMGKSEEMRRSAMQLCSLKLSAKTELMSSGMSHDLLKQIDFLMECNPDIVHSSFSITSYIYQNWGMVEKERIKENIKSVVERIHYYGKTASISFMDATRANPDELFELVQWSAMAGAERIRLADTTGAASPEGMYELVARCAERSYRYGAMMGVHCHNDFGLALANTLAAVKAGARLLDVSVNGLGDRSGNTPLAELAAALYFLYGRTTGIKLSDMTGLSRFTEQISGCSLPDMKPLVGKYAFSHELDSHIGAQMVNSQAYQCIPAESVGNKTEVLFGKFSGENSVEWESRKAGVKIDRSKYSAILKKLAENTGKCKGAVYSSKEFWKAVDLASRQDE